MVGYHGYHVAPWLVSASKFENLTEFRKPFLFIFWGAYCLLYEKVHIMLE